ncbi:MAG: transposase [Lachnospiraceae bacterium]|jgi:transposase|nr:transposase [Lachnospiraceae bacterium]
MNKGGTSSMAKAYNEEFKKQLVKENIQGKRYPTLEKEEGVAKSTLFGWVKKDSEECQISQPHTTNFPVIPQKEIPDLHKRIAELEKENLFLKRSP